MTYHWIDQPARLAEMASTLPADRPLFLDTEFMRERTFWPKLALVQVNAGEQGVWLIDPTTMVDDPGPLTRLLSGRTLVMHACSEDIEALRMHTGEAPAAIRDTQIAAALCGHDLQCSYQRLVRELTGTELPKDATRTDWLRRPLSAQQLAYARDDVVWLPELLALLEARLTELGRLAWWHEECDRQLAQATVVGDPEDAWRQVKGAGNLSGVALARLVALARWRDIQARERDMPRGFLVRDPAMLALALEGPQRREQLAALDLHPSTIRRDGDTLLALLREGETQTPPDALPGPPTPEERQLIKALRSRVAEIAESMQLGTEVLMRRRWLEALARAPEQLPEPLLGWRHDVVTRPLLEMLP
ncbi:ribonuclease D [Isoalcanivorax indicus]|uniref:ribonuclease D n=1 Tax=Isoalcanivorax indicus TaxID=2202653 RepID=UPI000DBA556D|nr:ribonuclease D [Isoalcanivorax indicus]